jgi:NAD(P)-dependent dehydrogenase (short-subunit alcohol dehydrogenase family)
VASCRPVYAGPVTEIGEDDCNKPIAVDVNGMFYGCKQGIPDMAKQGGGVVIDTAAIVAAVGSADRAAYCASGGAVEGLCK